MRHLLVICQLLCLLQPCRAVMADAAPEPASTKTIEWHDWSEDIFQKATKEHRLVILDLQAVWCHWCHVMEEKTYSNPKVIELMRSKYLAVRVDQDSRPDISNRYEDYGWPATIIFSPEGKELAKRSGYIPPEEFVSVLQAFIDNPVPGPSVTKEPKLQIADKGVVAKALRDTLNKNFNDEYDTDAGGWGFGHKYLQAESLEWALRLAGRGDEKSKKMAAETLKQALNLLDPAWGGFYQYSVGGKWTEPHFEKIMSVQADTLRLYSLAYESMPQPEFLKAAKRDQDFLANFLTSPEGAFYTSQDADLVQGEHAGEYFALDDKARRAKGIPRVDQHIYSRENGWAATALVQLSMASGDEKPLASATKAVEWIEKNRNIAGGGFRHDSDDKGHFYLGDNLYMGRAYLALYEATADRKWLQKAEATADFIKKKFSFTDSSGKKGGFVTSKSAKKSALSSLPQRDENTAAVRFFNMLFHYSGGKNYQAMADQAMRFVTAPNIIDRQPAAAALLADDELSGPPLHLTIVGSKSDPTAKALFKTAAAFPSSYKRLEWYDKSEGPMPNSDVKYPTTLSKPAAFICTGERCSTPIFDPQKLSSRILSLQASNHT